MLDQTLSLKLQRNGGLDAKGGRGAGNHRNVKPSNGCPYCGMSYESHEPKRCSVCNMKGCDSCIPMNSHFRCERTNGETARDTTVAI